MNTQMEAEMENELEVVELNVMHKHIDMADSTKLLFNSIFPTRLRHSMASRLEMLRLDASVWSDEGRKFVAQQPFAERFERVVQLAKDVSKFMVLDEFVAQDDEVSLDEWKKMYHDLKMILYRHAKEHKKMQRPVPLAMLTPGTVVEYDVEHVTKGAKIRTVKHLGSCGLGFGIISSEETHMEPGYDSSFKFGFPTSERDTFNSSHVTRVIKHVPGVVAYKSYGEELSGLQKYERYGNASLPGKSRRAYSIFISDDFLAAAELERLGVLNNSDQCVDFHQFARSAYRYCPGVRMRKLKGEEHEWAHAAVVVRKKKWKRWIRQNMNRFLISMEKQHAIDKAHQERMMEEYEVDMDYFGDSSEPECSSELKVPSVDEAESELLARNRDVLNDPYLEGD